MNCSNEKPSTISPPLTTALDSPWEIFNDLIFSKPLLSDTSNFISSNINLGKLFRNIIPLDILLISSEEFEFNSFLSGLALYTQQYDKVAGFSKSSGAGFQVGAKFNLNLGFNDFIGLQYYNSDEWSGVKLQIGQNF